MATTQDNPDTAGAAGGRRTRRHGARRAARVFATTPLRDRSLGELVATLSRDLALLVHQEIELVKADLRASAIKVATGAAGFVVAVIALVFALPVLSIAAALGIHALGISLGFSFLIVAGGYLLIALMAAGVGVLALRKAKPSTRAVDSVKADLHAIARKPAPDAAGATPEGGAAA
jgi:Putative Actinobacterial Holin-X, holin superfamily III